MRYLIRLAAISLIALTLKAAGLRAEDLTLANGTKRTDVTVSRAEPDGVVITTNSGIEKIPFSELSPGVQKKYGYDATKAATYSAAVAEAARARVEQEQRLLKARAAQEQRMAEIQAANAEREGKRTADAKLAAQKAQEAEAARIKAEEAKIGIAVEVAIKTELKDPDSLKIRSMSLSPPLSARSLAGNVIATVEFSAKNSYGGYGNVSTAIVTLHPDGTTSCYIGE
jgi:hypothetical protein